MKRNGFTLSELLIVVVIVGVLSAIAVPKFYPQKEKSIVAEAVGVLSVIRQGELGYRYDNGRYVDPVADSNWGMIGLEDPTNVRFSYTFSNVTDLATAKVVAARLPTGACTLAGSPPSYNGCTIELTLKTGAWSGSHPYRPN